MRAVVGGVDHDGVVADAEIVNSLENRSDRRVVFDHAVGIFGPGRQSRRATMGFPHMQFGFQNLGRFAGYYHQLFGEYPSDTRRWCA